MRTREASGKESPARDAKSNGATLDSIRAARDDYRAKQSTKVADQRAKFAERGSKSVTKSRDQFRAGQADSNVKRQAAVIAQRTQRLRQLEARNPDRARVVKNQGEFIACANGIGIGLAFSACSSWGWYLGWYTPCWYWNSWNDCGGYGYGYGWNSCHYPYSWLCHPYAWPYYSWYGCWPYGISYWWPQSYVYSYSPPVYYSTIILDEYDDADRTVYVESTPAEETVPASEPAAQVGESVEYTRPVPSTPSVGAVIERGPDTAARATTQYLALGDRAFREARYADAVHFYAKAVEFRPDDGVLYLVLSDALLATGDYHYGAFALRRALELDPSLAEQALDKHGFYSDPGDLDAQLLTLERYLADRPTDADARLLLAANYLFSGKAIYANDLLESGASAHVREEPAGKLLLAATKRALDAKK